jgi:hypothetical protein
MSLITNTDIAPNAGILGTQIADKTLQLRNLSDDVFGIVDSLNLTSTSYTTGTSPVGGVALDVHNFSVAHNLDFIPAAVGYILSDDGTSYYELPRTLWGIDGAGVKYVQVVLQLYANTTNITLQVSTFLSGIGSGGSVSANNPAFPLKIYLLQESAAQ